MERHARAGIGHHQTGNVPVDLQALHRAIVVGDEATAELLVRAALPRLCASLRTEWPGIASSMIEEAAEDAILWYLAHPTRYDPARAGLATFLHLVARRKMTHALRSERRRLAHEVPTGLALPDYGAGYPNAAWRGFADGGEEQGTSSLDLSKVLALAVSDAERSFVVARAMGASTRTLAAIIGAGDSPAEQRRAVHRVMARLRQRARRRPVDRIS